MSNPVVIGVTIYFRGNSYFAFEFDGDVTDDDAVKEAAWEALNEEKTLAPVEIVDQEYVDDFHSNQAMECWVEKGVADDHREPPPPPPTKRQLWRRVARLAGEICFYTAASHFPFAHELRTNSAESIKRLLGYLVVKRDTSGLCRKLVSLMAKLQAALKAWEDAP